MENSKKWYQSTTIIGAIVVVVSTITMGMGVDISDLPIAQQIVDVINSITVLVGSIMVIVGRFKANTKIQ